TGLREGTAGDRAMPERVHGPAGADACGPDPGVRRNHAEGGTGFRKVGLRRDGGRRPACRRRAERGGRRADARGGGGETAEGGALKAAVPYPATERAETQERQA